MSFTSIRIYIRSEVYLGELLRLFLFWYRKRLLDILVDSIRGVGRGKMNCIIISLDFKIESSIVIFILV